MKLVIPIVLFLLTPFFAFSQQELEKEDDILSVLGISDDNITKAVVQAETETTATIQIEFKGFTDKKYRFKASILNAVKKPMKEITPSEVALDARSGLADFYFQFEKVRTKLYTQPYIESRYLQVSVEDPEDPLTNFDTNINLGGKTFLFKYRKKWRVSGGGGGTSVTVDVKLVPYKSAAFIKKTTY